MKWSKWGLAAFMVLLMASGARYAHASSQVVVDHDYLIVDNEEVYLMSDGTTWLENLNDQTFRMLDYKLKELENGYGLSEDGRVLKLEYEDVLFMLPSPVDVAALSGEYALKKDGTVWTMDGKQLAGYADIVRIASEDRRLLTLSRSGELRSRDDSGSRTIDRFGSSDEVTSIAINDDGTVAVALKSGQAQYYEWNGKQYIPKVISGEARAVFYGYGPLLVLKQNGTVAPLEPSMLHDSRLGDSYPGLSGVASIEEINHFTILLVRLEDGSLVSYDTDTHELTPFTIPTITALDLKVRKPSLKVGESTSLSIAETWSNGASRWVPQAQAHLSIDKPYLLEPQEDGTLKATGVGEATVSVTSGGVTQTASVTVQPDAELLGGSQEKGVIYLPVQRTFQKLGGEVKASADGKSFTVQLGDRKFQLKQGSAIATVDGRQITMPGKVHLVSDVAVFPGDLLKSELGAVLSWDNSTKKISVSFGQAKLVVQTQGTYDLAKKKAIGSLSKYIGKVYWINRFDSDTRLQKVTIADLEPDFKGRFTIVFASPSGAKSWSIEAYSSTQIAQLFANKDMFFPSDPKKLYSFKADIWEKIRNSIISVGMTTQQVQISWGAPDYTDSATIGGVRYDIWYYGSHTAYFVNGIVKALY